MTERSPVSVVSVAAVAANGVIGEGDRLPWHMPHESRQYRERVADDPVAIGRRTYELFDDKPGRVQIVLSRTERDWPAESAYHADSVDEAIELAGELGDGVLYVLGGRGIYEAFLPEMDRQLISRIHGEYAGDVTYPAFEHDDAWELASETPYEGYTLEEWVRRAD
jgi:dihydrofolate reductase